MKNNKDASNGVWRTIDGRRVFIKTERAAENAFAEWKENSERQSKSIPIHQQKT